MNNLILSGFRLRLFTINPVALFLIMQGCLGLRPSVYSDADVPQYCPCFQNRAPSPQPSLENCTWYKENACCLNEEVDIMFTTLLPMSAASSECLQVLNYLYCYVCSPHQSTFFKRNTLTVCQESCDSIYNKCGHSLYKGIRLGKLYANGTQFCEARRFHVDKLKSGQCFDFSEMLVENLGTINTQGNTAILLSVLVGLATHCLFL